MSKLSLSEDAGQHFQTLLDSNGVIGPDGKSIPVTSVVAGATDASKATVVFDVRIHCPIMINDATDQILLN